MTEHRFEPANAVWKGYGTPLYNDEYVLAAHTTQLLFLKKLRFPENSAILGISSNLYSFQNSTFSQNNFL